MWKAVVQTTLLAGTLDILAAFASAYLRSGTTPDQVLRFVASGVFGQSAFSGGDSLWLWGLLFHFIIAFACTTCFFLIYPRLPSFLANPWVGGVLVAVVAWCVTELLIVPASQAPTFPFTLSRVVRSVLILVFCIGWPIAFGARFYGRKS